MCCWACPGAGCLDDGAVFLSGLIRQKYGAFVFGGYVRRGYVLLARAAFSASMASRCLSSSFASCSM